MNPDQTIGYFVRPLTDESTGPKIGPFAGPVLFEQFGCLRTAKPTITLAQLDSNEFWTFPRQIFSHLSGCHVDAPTTFDEPVSVDSDSWHEMEWGSVEIWAEVVQKADLFDYQPVTQEAHGCHDSSTEPKASPAASPAERGPADLAAAAYVSPSAGRTEPSATPAPEPSPSKPESFGSGYSIAPSPELVDELRRHKHLIAMEARRLHPNHTISMHTRFVAATLRQDLQKLLEDL